MTPQERQLLAELFDRLASLENEPRDPEALQATDEGLRRAPNALYPLVQSVLVQDEALKSADARIRELESQLGISPVQSQQGTSFLDNAREDLLGRHEPAQGSVPTVRPGASTPISSAWRTTKLSADDYPQQGGYGQPGDYPPQGQGMGSPGGAGAGGSFLGTAASAAAGAIGGALLMNSLRGLMGGHQARAGAFNPGGGAATPWGGGDASGSDLAKQAGLGDIGGAGRAASADDGSTQRAGLFDNSSGDNADATDDDLGYEDGDDFDDSGDDT
jgi:hypothetical protein